MHPVLQFLKEINDSCGDLILALIAVLTLRMVIREYKSKNYPIFTFTSVFYPRGDGTVLSLKIVNHADHPIQLTIQEARIENKFTTIIPKFDKGITLPIKGEFSFHLHHFDKDEIERLQGPSSLIPPSRPVGEAELHLRASSRSILDSAKRVEWALHLAIQFDSGTISSVQILKSDMRVPKFLGIC